MDGQWDQYRNRLTVVADRLRPICDRVNIRGTGAAQFVFAECGQTAVELSESINGVWIEFFAASDEAPIRENTYASYDEAVQDACKWLTG